MSEESGEVSGMGKNQVDWHSGEVLAFTEREGPGRPPAGPSRWMTGTLAGVLGVTFAGVFSSDTLCPDHRAWVQALAGVAFMGVVAALVALARGWAGAPLLTLLASVPGIGIGFLDAVHSPTRGRLVAVGFALVTVLAALMTWRTWRLARWDQGLTAASMDDSETIVPAEEAPQGVPAPETETSTLA